MIISALHVFLQGPPGPPGPRGPQGPSGADVRMINPIKADDKRRLLVTPWRLSFNGSGAYLFSSVSGENSFLV